MRCLGLLDSLVWFCTGCKAVVHQESFYCTNLGTQLVKNMIYYGCFDLFIMDALYFIAVNCQAPVIKKYFDSIELRTCKQCGHVNQT